MIDSVKPVKRFGTILMLFTGLKYAWILFVGNLNSLVLFRLFNRECSLIFIFEPLSNSLTDLISLNYRLGFLPYR